MVVIDGAGLTTILRVAVDVAEFASVTCTVKLYVPDAVGTPEIKPVAEVRVRPVGKLSALTDHVSEPVPPVAVSVCE